jgi:hypothetical protein
MATVRIFFSGERVGPQLARSAKKNADKILASERGAAKDVVAYVVPKARADIAKAGKFGGRWTDGFNGKVTEGGGFIRVAFTMPKTPPMKFWRVFQNGAIIHGKPLLWIPLSFAKDAQGVRAKDYPGKLFRVNRKGGLAPLLMTRSGGGPAQAKYFGKASVKIPKKFHLVEIIKAGAQQMKTFYSKRMK